MKSEKELRELDSWIAEHVMGLSVCDRHPAILMPNEYVLTIPNKIVRARIGGDPTRNFEPTTDPAAAMLVLEKCVKKCDESGDSVDLSFTKQTGQFEVGMMQIGFGWRIELMQSSSTLPLSICKFAKELFSK